jgi:hypothetical protein
MMSDGQPHRPYGYVTPTEDGGPRC